MIDIGSLPVELETLANWLKVLADPNRLRIVHLLMEGVHCNCELGEVLDIAPNLISHHLRVLRKAGLVNTERDALDARWIYYSLDPKALAELHRMLGQFFDPDRIKPRRPTCGPQSTFVPLTAVNSGKD